MIGAELRVGANLGFQDLCQKGCQLQRFVRQRGKDLCSVFDLFAGRLRSFLTGHRSPPVGGDLDVESSVGCMRIVGRLAFPGHADTPESTGMCDVKAGSIEFICRLRVTAGVSRGRHAVTLRRRSMEERVEGLCQRPFQVRGEVLDQLRQIGRGRLPVGADGSASVAPVRRGGRAVLPDGGGLTEDRVS